MAIDSKSFNAAATKGDVAGVAIECVLALYSVLDALEALRSGGDLAKPTEDIRASISRFDQVFIKLTGWTPE